MMICCPVPFARLLLCRNTKYDSARVVTRPPFRSTATAGNGGGGRRRRDANGLVYFTNVLYSWDEKEGEESFLLSGAALCRRTKFSMPKSHRHCCCAKLLMPCCRIDAPFQPRLTNSNSPEPLPSSSFISLCFTWSSSLSV